MAAGDANASDPLNVITLMKCRDAILRSFAVSQSDFFWCVVFYRSSTETVSMLRSARSAPFYQLHTYRETQLECWNRFESAWPLSCGTLLRGDRWNISNGNGFFPFFSDFAGVFPVRMRCKGSLWRKDGSRRSSVLWLCFLCCVTGCSDVLVALLTDLGNKLKPKFLCVRKGISFIVPHLLYGIVV